MPPVVRSTSGRRLLSAYLLYYHSSLPREGRTHATTRPRAGARSRGGIRGAPPDLDGPRTDGAGTLECQQLRAAAPGRKAPSAPVAVEIRVTESPTCRGSESIP